MKRLTDEIETIVRDTLKTAAPGLGDTIRAAIARSIMLKVSPAILARRPAGELEPLAQVKRLALDCQPDQVPATLAAIARICIDAERALELESRKNSRTGPVDLAKP